MVRMSQAANVSTTICPRALMFSATAALACVALLASCGGSASRSARHVDASAHSALPTTRASPTTPTTIPRVRYRVKRGDTLAAIAPRFRVSIDAIVFVNHLADPNRVAEGQVLLIPPPLPLRLVVTPSVGPSGGAFQLHLTGARPSEMIRFEIDSPTGKYQGPPHTVSTDGTATATYQTSGFDPSGIYEVVATGNQGTTARAIFGVVTPSTDHT
jgi:LysM repeat protein